MVLKAIRHCLRNTRHCTPDTAAGKVVRYSLHSFPTRQETLRFALCFVVPYNFSIVYSRSDL